jgi:protein-S-isoprenylcysteine O-methyltransferase Ste14
MGDKMATIFWSMTAFLAQGLVVVYPGVWAFWFIMHLNIDRWRKVGKRSYWIACAGFPVLGGAALLFRERLFSLQWPMPAAVRLLGLLALAGSAAVAFQASRKIPKRALVGMAELEPAAHPQPLLQSGIYARTRNPVYLAHILLIFAAAALTGYAANWLLLAIDFVVLPLLIRAEERELKKRYGSEFLEYMRRVPRLVPAPRFLSQG